MHSTVWTKSWRKYIASWMSSGQSGSIPNIKKETGKHRLSASAVKVFAGLFYYEGFKDADRPIIQYGKPMKSNRGHGGKRLTTFISRYPMGLPLPQMWMSPRCRMLLGEEQYFSPPFYIFSAGCPTSMPVRCICLCRIRTIKVNNQDGVPGLPIPHRGE